MTVDEHPASAPVVARRPVVLTVAVVLVYLNALADVLIGILVLLSRYDVASADVLPTSLLGAGIILFGLLLLGVASGLARGSRLSRLFATCYLGVLMTLNAVTVATTDAWDWSASIQLVVQGILVVVLWTPPGSRHFARERAA